MKKMLIGALVGGLIIFIWQFVSFAALNFHQKAQQYTEKEQAILDFLKSQNLEEGGYIIPGVPEGASREEYETKMKAAQGQPWASIQYHSSLDTGMTMNMIRGFLVNVIAVFLFCWMAMRISNLNFGRVLGNALVLGMIIFLNAPYINYIWYKSFDIWAFLLDYLVSWGLTGLWLGWWLNRRRSRESVVGSRQSAVLSSETQS